MLICATGRQVRLKRGREGLVGKRESWIWAWLDAPPRGQGKQARRHHPFPLLMTSNDLGACGLAGLQACRLARWLGVMWASTKCGGRDGNSGDLRRQTDFKKARRALKVRQGFRVFGEAWRSSLAWQRGPAWLLDSNQTLQKPRR